MQYVDTRHFRCPITNRRGVPRLVQTIIEAKANMPLFEDGVEVKNPLYDLDIYTKHDALVPPVRDLAQSKITICQWASRNIAPQILNLGPAISQGIDALIHGGMDPVPTLGDMHPYRDEGAPGPNRRKAGIA